MRGALYSMVACALCMAATASADVIINEVDADTAGTDILEFIELYDGGVGNTALDGLVVVLFNGSDDASYNAFDLDTFSTDASGYFTLGNTDVPGVDLIFPSNGLQNGADAVALYTGNAADWPEDTPIVVDETLLDAIVYDTNDSDDAGLLVLLNVGQPQLNEDENFNKDFHSNQRCPNGAGGARNTDSHVQATTTPDATNNCAAPLGACCDRDLLVCVDDVEEVQCEFEWTQETICDDLEPPCEPAPTGACCDRELLECNDGVEEIDCPFEWSLDMLCDDLEPPCMPPTPLQISELRIDQPSTDNDEYFELSGDPATALDGLTYIVIGDGVAGSGVVEAVVDLSAQAIGANGFFVAAEDTFTIGTADLVLSSTENGLNFENSDNVTHLLVSDFTGAIDDDLDTDDDGVLDVIPWSGITDCVALIETPGSGDQVYCATQVGPDGTFVPGQAYRCVPTGDWQIGAFDPVGGDDTPNTTNAGCPIVMNELRIDQTGADNDEYFELASDAGTALDGLTYLVIGDGTGGSGVIEAVVDLGGQAIDAAGFFVAAEATFTIGTADLVTNLNFENSDNVTHLLVFDFTGSDGDDLDTDDDGVLDIIPWATELDCVALIETPGEGEFVYCDTQVGPDGTFVPGHVYRCFEDGDWLIGTFDPVGTDDTPGAQNLDCPEAGACCNRDTFVCTDDVVFEDCQGEFDEWAAGTLCADLEPPCEPPSNIGACCDDGSGFCAEDVTEEDCLALGRRWGGPESTCETIDPPCMAMEPAELQITEIVDGTIFSQPRWVEVTNCGDVTVDLSFYSIGNFNNGGLFLGGGQSTRLMGTLDPGEIYVYAYAADTDTTFQDVYGFPPDQFAGGGFINGNDVVALFLGLATEEGTDAIITDVYGVLGVDGVGEVWEYTDGYARRRSDTLATDIFDPADWFFGGVDSLETGDDVTEAILIKRLTFPDSHACTCPDIDGNGAVDMQDLLQVLANWGSAGGPADLDGDGTVGMGDLLLVLAHWGPCI